MGPQMGPQTLRSSEKQTEPGRISADEAPGIRLRCRRARSADNTEKTSPTRSRCRGLRCLARRLITAPRAEPVQ